MSSFTQVHDELARIGVTISKDDFVSLDIMGLPKSWYGYQDSMNEREKLPNWQHLWFDLVEEEIRQNIRD